MKLDLGAMLGLMLQYAQASLDDAVLECGPRRDVDSATFRRDDNDRAYSLVSFVSHPSLNCSLPFKVTPRARLTLPVMVRWSSSTILGMLGMCC